jgi:hypothetical protein
MASGISAIQVQIDPAGRIAQDVPCIHCGYNLRSLLADQACPECNQAVGESLRGDLLQFGNPAWLRRLAGGMGWLIVGSILFLLTRGAHYLLAWLGSRGAIPITGTPWPFHAGWVIAQAATLIGVWKATSREPRTLGMPAGFDARTLAGPLLAAGFLLGYALMPLRNAGTLRVALLGQIPTIIMMSGWICLYIHLANLARRVPAVRIIRLTYVALVVYVLGKCLGIGLWIWSWVWVMPTLRAGTGTWPSAWFLWLRMIDTFLPLVETALTVTVLILCRLQFRKALRQSQASVQQPSA